LVFGFLQLHHFAEFVGLARLALANDFSRRLEQAEDLAFGARIMAEDACEVVPVVCAKIPLR
jgi:hypothetical protein